MTILFKMNQEKVSKPPTATVLALVAVLLAMQGVQANYHNCTKETECSEGTTAVSVDGKSHALWLVWQGAADRVAVALLQRLLTARGFCRLALCEAPQGLCSLIEIPHEDLSSTLVIGFENISRLQCYSARVLDVVGEQRAPLRPHLHVALARDVAARSTCSAAAPDPFYSDTYTPVYTFPLPAYVPYEWSENNETETEVRRLISSDRFQRINCTHAELTTRIRDGNDTFVFVDAELWSDEPRVLVVRNESDSNAAPELLCGEKVDLIRHAPILLQTLRKYAPRPRHLREILVREEEQPANLPRGEAALGAAFAWAANNEAEFNETCKALQPRSERYRLVVYRCQEDKAAWTSGNNFKTLTRAISAKMKKVTLNRLVHVWLEFGGDLDCLDRENLRERIQELILVKGAHRLLGVAAAGAGVEAAARLATQLNVTLAAYDVQPRLKDASYANLLNAGARTAHLASAMRSVLAACDWRRVALLSEETPAAAAVARALRASLSMREDVLSRDNKTLKVTLSTLKSANARVFVLNAGAEGAARALAVGAELGLMREAGCAWVAREWAWGRAPPVPLLALRWEVRAPGETGSERVRALWNGRDWPQHAAPLADALLTLGLGYAPLLQGEFRFDHQTIEAHRLLRSNLVRGPPLEGIGSSLTFDEEGIMPPPVHLELYEAGNASSALYEPGDVAACPAPKLDDGTSSCNLPTGDEFAPNACLDLPILLGVFLLLLAALVGTYGAVEWRKRENALRQKRERKLRDNAYTELLARQRGTVTALAEWHVDRERVRLLSELGSGRHGRVWLAALAPEAAGGSRAARYVAAKEPHAGCSPAEESELLREAAALAGLAHEHVVRLAGVCVAGGPPLLLTEQAFFGDLQRYLWSRRALAPGAEGEAAHVSAAALTRLARQAALALAYLAARRVVHCDVRAANCLVDERRSLKLADFGMARELGTGEGSGVDEYACRRRKLVPVRWMPPESLRRGVFSPASDVWALGVLVLELVSLGERPFGALDSPDVVALVKAGGCARLPAACSRETRWLTQACWRGEPEERPSARQVADWLATRSAALLPVLQQSPANDSDDDSGFGEAPAPVNSQNNQFDTLDSNKNERITS